MMKYFLILVFVWVSFLQVLAQESEFEKGANVISLGIGFGSGLYTGADSRSRIPTISATFEIAVMDGVVDKGSIGLGGYLGYSSHKIGDSFGGYEYKDFLIGARGCFHYPIVNKLDTYTGIILGYNFAHSEPYGNFLYPYHSHAGLIYGWLLGGKYYFTDAFAVLGELGVGITYLNLGVAFKF